MTDVALLFALSCVGGAPSAAAASAPSHKLHLVFQPGGKLWLDGTSTLHSYSSSATMMAGFADLRLEPAPNDNVNSTLSIVAREARLDSFVLTVPVVGLKSDKGALDKKLWKALKAMEAPVIRLRLTSRTPIVDSRTAGAYQFQARGTLTAAGVTREIALAAVGRVTAEGLRVTGSEDLLMSDFGITPPRMLMGTLVVRDKIAVHFDVLLGLAAAPSDEEAGK